MQQPNLNKNENKNMTTSDLRKSMARSPLRRGLLLIPLLFGCFALSPAARAVCQEGCLTNNNTVLGDDALLNNTGFGNTAVGFNALLANATGNSNTATGNQALITNTTGGGNTANGYQALFWNSTGSENTANGNNAIAFNTTGSENTASGNFALNANTTGFSNTADGDRAMWFNTTGSGNTALGRLALAFNTSGNKNIAIGFNAGSNLTSGNNNIDIGNLGRSHESFTIRIGNQQTNTYVAGISGATVTGTAVVVNGSGQLGVAPSSARFKEAIKSMDNASEALFSLKPVTFRYKKGIDPQGIPQFGLVAEEVEKVNPDLVVRDANSAVYTVRYDAVNAMLLNEFLKEHRKNEAQEATIAQLKQDFQSRLADQQKQIETLTTGLQKVSTQLEATKPAPQVVKNP